MVGSQITFHVAFTIDEQFRKMEISPSLLYLLFRSRRIGILANPTQMDLPKHHVDDDPDLCHRHLSQRLHLVHHPDRPGGQRVSFATLLHLPSLVSQRAQVHAGSFAKVVEQRSAHLG